MSDDQKRVAILVDTETHMMKMTFPSVTKFTILALIPLILSIGIVPAIPFNDASAIAYFPPPLKQISNGVTPENVTCTEGLAIVLKSSDGSPACITPSSVEKLIQRGWAIEKVSTVTSELLPKDAETIAEKAFVYAYPMLENYHTMYDNAVDESSDLYVAPFNVIHHNEGLTTHEDKWVVSPNSDTIYSRAWLDLRAEPVVLLIPAIEDDRYYTFQLIDYYTNNFDYIGTRTEGNDGGTYLIAGPNWDGKIPHGIDDVFESTTDFIYILGRTQVLSDGDEENALAIMYQYELKTQSEFLGVSPPQSAPDIDFISWDTNKGYGIDFVNYFNLMLTWSETPPSEKQLFDDFEKIGIKEGETVDWTTMNSEIKDAINNGAKTGYEKIESGIPNIGEFRDGWSLTLAFGDADHRAENYLQQAVGAMLGLYGNTQIESFYPVALSDADKNPLDATKNNYVYKFDSEPPVGAFWSLTMYDGKTKLLLDNSLDRYLVNSLIDLQKNNDGSFEVYVQHESPGQDKESNWLPAPDGEFYTVLRLYLPGDEILNDTWTMPEIVVMPKSSITQTSSTCPSDQLLIQENNEQNCVGAQVALQQIFEGVKIIEGSTLKTSQLITKLALSSSNSETLTQQEISNIATLAYVYGYSPVDVMEARELMAKDPETGEFSVNTMINFKDLLGPDWTAVVSPNRDTLYSPTYLDLTEEPLVFHVPDLGDRYYTFQMIDFYTNNFDYIGKRTTGTAENDFVIVGPNWSGDIPSELDRIDSPTPSIFHLGRTLVSDEADVSVVNTIQEQYTLTKLSDWKDGNTSPPQTLAYPDYLMEGDFAFFHNMNAAITENPPPSNEQNIVDLFAKINVGPNQTFDENSLDDITKQTIMDAIVVGDSVVTYGSDNIGEKINGWHVPSPETGEFGENFILRSGTSKSMLYLNSPVEAMYPKALEDLDGDLLTGENKYVIHFDADKIPPVDAFWSVTIYNSKFLLVDNEIDRYNIGDRTPGLKYNDDGSLDVLIQHEAPDDTSNWLPAPADGFYLINRLYNPQEPALNGDWVPSGVEKNLNP